MSSRRETQVIVAVLALTALAFAVGMNAGLDRAQHQRCRAGYVEACRLPVTR